MKVYLPIINSAAGNEGENKPKILKIFQNFPGESHALDVTMATT